MTTSALFGTWWSLVPAMLAIALALKTKEVNSSLFLGIVSGGILYGWGSGGFWCVLEKALVHVVNDGFIAQVADKGRIGIVLFVILLGSFVALVGKTGASAAFGRWAEKHVKSRVGAQLATIVMGLLVFVDDGFNCLAVGSVMRPVARANRVSTAKLAYLVDSTAAPVCIIAPVSSWAAAVAGFAKGAGAENGLALFAAAIPYNFYAILTIVTLFAVTLMKFDFGSMRRHEQDAAAGRPDLGALVSAAEARTDGSERGRVCDLVVPVVVLVAACVTGMVHSGGFFTPGATFHDFAGSLANADGPPGLALGALVAMAFSVAWCCARRVVSFRSCMEAFPAGFHSMVPGLIVLACAWTLNGMTESLGAREFVSGLVNGPAAGLRHFLPAVFFAFAVLLSFATGTSWGTFGILIPIVLAAMPQGREMILGISACLAGSVCGDHCSPISDTTIMASVGTQCDHIVHVSTQLPYALTVAAVSLVAYLVAPFVGTAWISLPLAIVLMLATLWTLKSALSRRKTARLKGILHKSLIGWWLEHE